MLWCLLFLLLTCEALDCGPGRQGLSCQSPTPTNVTLNSDPRRQTLRVMWRGYERAPCYSGACTFQVQVARGTHTNVVNKSDVTVRAENGWWSWTWFSEWPLQCADHLVRVGGFNWTKWVVNEGKKEPQDGQLEGIRLFPKQKVVIKEGSTQGFCCIPTNGSKIMAMNFNRRNYSASDIGDGVKGIIVENLSSTMTNGGVYFQCTDSSGENTWHMNYVTFLPQKPQNLTCETKNLRTVNCTWNPGRKPNLADKYKPNYTLLIQNSSKPAIQCQSSFCTFSTIPGWKKYNLTVMVMNDLGQESESYVSNLTDMVSLVPLHVSVEPGVHSADVSWSLEGDFSGMEIVCQIRSGVDSTPVEWTFQGLAGEYKGRLDALQSYTEYNVSVSCSLAGANQGSRTWVRSQLFRTQMKAPSVTLDLWRTIELFDQGRNVTLLWKKSQNNSETNIKSYQIVWDEQKNLSISTNDNRAAVTIGLRRCEISVRAVNDAGSSKPATIIIPPMELVSGPPPETKRLKNGTLKGFSLSWVADANATCGYTVEWYSPSEDPEVQWKTLPVNSTSLVLPADTFTFHSGHRYIFRIFGCTRDGHWLLEEQAGYTKEEKPTKRPVQVEVDFLTTAELRWTFQEDDPTHPGFITGYLVTVQWGNNSQKSPYTIPVADPRLKTCTIPNLLEDMEFTVFVQAQTVAGLGPQSDPVKNHPNYSGFLKILASFLVLLGLGLLMCAFHKLTKDYILKVFCKPVKITVAILELDSSLYQVSEKIQVVQAEDCPCCEIEILETPEKPKGQLQYCPQTPASSSTIQTGLTVSGFTNMTYFFVPKQDSHITVPSSSVMISEQPWGSPGGYISTADIVNI
ncbi:leukemia inhibitory factor receptor-like [Arapaima gigas]